MQPLHVAVLNDNAAAVGALLQLGADPLAECPDCYPSYERWKRQRGLQAMQVGAAAAGDGHGLPDGCPSRLPLCRPLREGWSVETACPAASGLPTSRPRSLALPPPSPHQQALMNGDGPALLPALMQLFGSEPLAVGAPRRTAVDLACCVARSIPCVEEFVARGVQPSAAALALGSHVMPMMR
jgi:hypothetical protein